MRQFLAILLLVLAGTAHAAPDLGTYRDIQGIRAYRDHQQENVWYMAPAEPKVAQREDGVPDYALEVFRYHGRKGTGDQGDFLVRGVMSLGIDRQRASGDTASVRKGLRTSGVRNPRLRSMPVKDAQITLMFADQSYSWHQKSRWGGRQLLIPLAPEMMQVLWHAVEEGQTLVSLVVEERLEGVHRVKKEWQKKETFQTWTLPVEMDMAAHPSRFRKTDLGGRMSHGYTGIDVLCFDFIEGLVPGLYAKVVRVAIPTAGRELIEDVTFRDDGEYRFRIEFNLAKALDWPYRVQVVHVMEDGRREAGPWMEKQGESILDVTSYREPEGGSAGEGMASSNDTAPLSE